MYATTIDELNARVAALQAAAPEDEDIPAEKNLVEICAALSEGARPSFVTIASSLVHVMAAAQDRLTEHERTALQIAFVYALAAVRLENNVRKNIEGILARIAPTAGSA